MKAPTGLSLSPPAQALPLAEGMLDEFGWTALEARTDFRAEELVQILAELAAEDCGHSWRSHLSEIRAGSAEEQAARLNQRAQAFRPTVLFVYIARDLSGNTEAVAKAPISDRVQRDFAHSGFPVLARCFIRPAFRGNGLYPYLVRHRVQLCQAHWGEQLRAIHMGAASSEIREALTGGVGQEPGFVHVGEELLRVAGRDFRIEDLIAPTEPFLARLRASLPRVTAGQREFGSALDAFLSRGVAALSYGELLEQWRVLGTEAPAPLQQLFDLLDAIGLIR
jgi:hypothetical protein